MSYRDTVVPNQCIEATVLFTRVNEIIDLIPEEFDSRSCIVHSLRDRQNSIYYTHPGAMRQRWHEVARVLEGALPDPEKCVWAKQIAELYGKPV